MFKINKENLSYGNFYLRSWKYVLLVIRFSCGVTFLFWRSLIQIGVWSRVCYAGEEQVILNKISLCHLYLHIPLSVPVYITRCVYVAALVLMFSVLPLDGWLRPCRLISQWIPSTSHCLPNLLTLSKRMQGGSHSKIVQECINNT